LTRFGGRPESGVSALQEGDAMGRPFKYPPEFRREAVDLVRSSDRPRVEIARSLGLHDRTLGN